MAADHTGSRSRWSLRGHLAVLTRRAIGILLSDRAPWPSWMRRPERRHRPFRGTRRAHRSGQLRWPGAHEAWRGRSHRRPAGRPEATTVSAQGIAFEGIDVLGFRRSVSPRNVLAAAQKAPWQRAGVGILRRARADVAVGTGWHVRIPVAMAAAMLRNSPCPARGQRHPASANRLAGSGGRGGGVVPGRGALVPGSGHDDGKPIRPEVATWTLRPRPDPDDHFGLEAVAARCRLGGAREPAASTRRPSGLPALASRRAPQVLHLVGPKSSRGRGAPRGSSPAGDRVLWRPRPGRPTRMDLAYSVADLAMCRSGAATLFEIGLGRPACRSSVPYPYATPTISGRHSTSGRQ